MEKIEIMEVQTSDGAVAEIVKIDKGNDEFIWMRKSEYDRQQAEQSTPIVIDEAEAK
jgi:hypothetical protein